MFWGRSKCSVIKFGPYENIARHETRITVSYLPREDSWDVANKFNGTECLFLLIQIYFLLQYILCCQFASFVSALAGHCFVQRWFPFENSFDSTTMTGLLPLQFAFKICFHHLVWFECDGFCLKTWRARRSTITTVAGHVSAPWVKTSRELATGRID